MSWTLLKGSSRGQTLNKQKAHHFVMSFFFILVREKGLEPLRLAAHAPQTCVYTIPPPARVPQIKPCFKLKSTICQPIIGLRNTS